MASVIYDVVRFSYVRNFLLGALSVLVGMGIAYIAMQMMGWSEGTQEFWFLILAFLIGIPLDLLFHQILNKNDRQAGVLEVGDMLQY